MEVSIVIPVYNSDQSIEILVARIRACMQDLSFEIILVDDGSKDRSSEVIFKLATAYSNIKAISLRKNFGEHQAVLCGLHQVSGKYAVIIDDDLQNPPEEITHLYQEIQKGYDVVYSYYDKKKHPLFRNLGSRLHSLMMHLLICNQKGLYLSSFKILNSEIIPEICNYSGPFPHIDGLILRLTHHIGKVKTQHNERPFGKSNYNLGKLLQLYLNMMVNFSIKPLRVFTLSGFVIFISGLLLSAFFIWQKYHQYEPAGYTSTAIFILLLSGFQIIFMGLIGEYMGRQYLHQNNTPQFSIRKSVNLNPKGHE